jgi:hypothetical protein
VIASSYSFVYTFLDFFAGAFVHTCRKASRHFVAIEGDKDIFKAILEPLIVNPVTEGFKKQRLDATSTADDLEVKEYPDTVRACCFLVPRKSSY